jgi:hypothetical protein
MTRQRWLDGQIYKYLLSALLSISAIVAVVFVSGAFIGSDFRDADIKNDWVVASALLDGVNPYSDLHVLAARYADGQYTPPATDAEYEGPNRTPRTPGAIVLGALWVPIPLANLVEWNNLIGRPAPSPDHLSSIVTYAALAPARTRGDKKRRAAGMRRWTRSKSPSSAAPAGRYSVPSADASVGRSLQDPSPQKPQRRRSNRLARP